ncbi:hypothetical protein SEPCBS119000_003551 [Sporothrix epigloea]|uniref:Serine peptidase n=1 Tax=Sporothrix epigloea TaxID=1892477 RepID=A0ABP0DMC1_9PEZI
MKGLLTLAAAVLAGAPSAAALGRSLHLPRVPKAIPPPLSLEDVFGPNVKRALPKGIGEGVFEQLLDHERPELGTFSQRYWYCTRYWSGPGAPVVMMTPGEVAADDYLGYLVNHTITGQFAQAVKGASILIEHRYWGESSPYDELTTENLQYLTVPNAIADMTYFARNVKLPFDTNGTSNAPNAPWVLSGGSYSGALTGWVASVAPGTFWAYHASSAVVHAEGNFWQYHEPIKQGLPQNCSADSERVAQYINQVLETGTPKQVQALKEKFNLGAVEHADDFASIVGSVFGFWQDLQFYPGDNYIFQFCDYVENAVPEVFGSETLPGPEGVGLEKALNGYAQFISDYYFPGYCGSYGVDENDMSCTNSHNASNPIYLDIAVDNGAGRQWTWLLCNEPLMYWQTAAPAGVRSLIPSLVSYAYDEEQCALYFPREDGFSFGSDPGVGKTPTGFNMYTKGWGAKTERLMWANGQFDPWRDVTVSSDFRPQGPLVSTPEAPVHVIPGGIHCTDLIYENAEVNDDLMAIVQNEIAIMKGWVEEFYKQ